MKNMEREKFEESWKQAFENAEVSPSDKVWTNIHLELEKSRGGELKRRLLFYQMLAAASVVFAMAIGGFGYYYSFKSDNNLNGLAANYEGSRSREEGEGIRPSETNESVQPNDTREQAKPSPSVNAPGNDARQLADASDLSNNGTNKTNSDNDISNRTSDNLDKGMPDSRQQGEVRPDRNSEESRPAVAPASEDINNSLAYNPSVESSNIAIESSNPEEEHMESALPLQLDERELPSLYTAREVKLNFDKPEPEVDPVLAMLAKLEQRELEVQNKEDKKRKNSFKEENLWTSVGFSAGSFNAVQAPSASGGSAPGTMASMAVAGPIVDQESKATGYSYSMGVNVGTRISDRWVLQGGVNYLTHLAEYTSNSVVVDGPGGYLTAERYKPATTNAIVKADAYDLSNKIVYSAPYSVNNSMRYLSIPMQAGYLIVDKTVGVQLNAGVATDLFLQNTVKGEGDQLASATQSSGSDSPYRTVNLSGLVGTEVSYRFGERYRVSLNPGLRYPFNTIYKSELGVGSSPLTFDVGLRFRYIFR